MLLFSRINDEISNFQNQSEAHTTNRLLQNHEYDTISKELGTVEEDSGKAILDLYDTANTWNPSIKITQDLGGTIGSLKNDLETAKNKIMDLILIKRLTKELYETLKKTEISSFEAFEALKNEIAILSGKAILQKTSLEGVKATQSDLKNNDQTTFLEKTKKEITETQEKLVENEKQKGQINQAKEKEIEDLLRLENSLKPQEVNEVEPEPLAFSSDWEDKLLTMKDEFQKKKGHL